VGFAAQVMNPEVKLESFVVEGRDIVMTADENGPNSGAFLTISSPWAKAFLDRLDRMRGLVDAKSLGFQYEQRALHSAMGTDPDVANHLAFFPPCAFNSQLRAGGLLTYPSPTLQFGENDFVVHLAGYYGIFKERLFVKMLMRSRSWCPYPDELLARIPEEAQEPVAWNGRAHPFFS
jgi:galactosyl transferase GMA12/MNN10 family